MGEKALAAGLLTDSASFIKELDGGEFKPTLAAWHFCGDADEWRLLIGGPEFDKLLPKQEALAYQKVAEALSASDFGSLSISYVKVVATDNPLTKTLKLLIETKPDGIALAHFSDITINGIFVEEMVVRRSA
ncbi:MAG: hypothetical protein GY862_24875 [Gammaproteobacteria bacterium]|nr:hypothetical protein [Gammaproteobacteria bacterium]